VKLKKKYIVCETTIKVLPNGSQLVIIGSINPVAAWLIATIFKGSGGIRGVV
jgi:hypothetical protein